MTQPTITQQLIVDEALRRGWKIENQKDKYYDVVNSQGARIRFAMGRPDSITSKASVLIAMDKLKSLEFLEGLGFNLPPYCLYSDISSAYGFLMNHGTIVAKSNKGEQGNGVRLHIQTKKQLDQAIHEIQKENPGDIILQKQLAGKEYRLLVIGDELFAAAYRKPAAQTDSESSLPSASISSGGSTVDVTDAVHEDYKNAAIRIAQEAGLAICGLDILVEDISQPMPGYLPILEINSMPGFRPHTEAEGMARNPAPAVLDYAFIHEEAEQL